MIMEANDFWNVFQEWWNCSIIWSGFLQMILKPILWWSFSIYFSTSFLILIRNFLSLKNQIVKGMMAWNTSQREDNFQFPLKLLKIMNHESIYFWACKVSTYTGSLPLTCIHFGRVLKIRDLSLFRNKRFMLDEIV